MRLAATTPTPQSASLPTPRSVQGLYMEKITGLVLRHGRGVVVFWAVVVVLAAFFALRLPSVIHGGTDTIRESESGWVTQTIDEKFGQGAGYLFTTIVESVDIAVDDARFAATAATIADALTAVPGVRSVRHYWNTGAPDLLGRDRRSALLLVQPNVASYGEAEELTASLREAVHSAAIAPGFSATVTGTPAMFYDLSRNSSADLLDAERIGIPATLIILLVVFRAPLAAALPLLLALASVTITSAGLYVLSRWMPISVFSQNVVSMVGLGVGVDYALFVVSRFRDQLALGQSVREAAFSASAITGPAILISGTAVGIGFLALLLVHARFLHGIAFGGLLVVTSAVAASLTLLPVLLLSFGNALNWLGGLRRPRLLARGAGSAWSRWARLVMEHPWRYLVPACAVLTALIAPVARMEPRNVSAGDMPVSFEARRGLALLQSNFAAGWMGPVIVLLQSRPGGSLWEQQAQEAVLAIAARLSDDPRVAEVQGYPQLLRALGERRRAYGDLVKTHAVSSPATDAAISPDGSTALLIVLPRSAPERQEMLDYIKELRGDPWPEAKAAGITIRIGGPSAMISDFDTELFGSLWHVVPAVLAATFAVLLFAFRSVLIPAKAVLMNLVSALAAYGFLVLLFQDGFGATMLGIDPPGGLNSLVVLMLFTILFGLSMDYEVFLLRQVQEEYQLTGENRTAVASGLARSAGLITSAAAIMVCLFGSFGFTQLTATREFGLGLAFAVGLDATVIRLLLVPALMELFGAANWWFPGRRPESSLATCKASFANVTSAGKGQR